MVYRYDTTLPRLKRQFDSAQSLQMAIKHNIPDVNLNRWRQCQYCHQHVLAPADKVYVFCTTYCLNQAIANTPVSWEKPTTGPYYPDIMTRP